MPTELEKLELAVYGREREKASQQLLLILRTIESESGAINASIHPPSRENEDLDTYLDHLIHRLAAAITSLFCDPAFQLSEHGAREIMRWKPLILAIFVASHFHSTDHILKTYITHKNQGTDEYTLNARDLNKFAILYSADSSIPLNMDTLWYHSKTLAIALAWGLVSPGYLGTEAGHRNRNLLLPWLSEKLNQLDSLDCIPTHSISEVYMHCSYATIPERHVIKRSINRLVRQSLIKEAIHDLPVLTLPIPPSESKPVAMVMLEWFGSNHSIYRTHSKSIEAMRQDFHLIGIGYGQCVEHSVRDSFDLFIEIPLGALMQQVLFVRQLCKKHKPALIYMVSLGMSPLNIFASNLRLAPLQVTSWGHPASSHSNFIDQYAAERDLLPEPALFSEEILWLESDEMPFRITDSMTRAIKKDKARTKNKQAVQIAICASMMKLNPTFLATLTKVAQSAGTPIHFHFLVLGCVGIVYRQVSKTVAKALPGISTVYQQLTYDRYMDVLANCDLSLNPFPFGNCNGIVDGLLQGIVGVCMQGPHLFESIDQALYRRLGLPEWLITTDEESYIKAAIRLINDSELRQQIALQFGTIESVQPLHQGQDRALSRKLLARLHA